jgi:hypothetical protein
MGYLSIFLCTTSGVRGASQPMGRPSRYIRETEVAFGECKKIVDTPFPFPYSQVTPAASPVQPSNFHIDAYTSAFYRTLRTVRTCCMLCMIV